MKKIIKVVGVLIVTIILVTLMVLSYYKLADIQSKIPQKMKENYNVVAKRFMGRNVFVISHRQNEEENNQDNILCGRSN